MREARDHRTTFTFTLPVDQMLLPVVSGRWQMTRGCSVEVAANGAVTVTSIDGSETYARREVQKAARDYLKSLPRLQEPATLTAYLSAPNCRGRPEPFQIVMDAKISIADTRWTPLVA
jgi:hypothetical protein